MIGLLKIHSFIILCGIGLFPVILFAEVLLVLLVLSMECSSTQKLNTKKF